MALTRLGHFCPPRTCQILQPAGRAQESNLANDKKSFKGVRSNVKLDPKRTDDINMGQKVSVYCELGCYINFDNSKAGITIKPIQFDFEEDELKHLTLKDILTFDLEELETIKNKMKPLRG